MSESEQGRSRPCLKLDQKKTMAPSFLWRTFFFTRSQSWLLQNSNCRRGDRLWLLQKMKGSRVRGASQTHVMYSLSKARLLPLDFFRDESRSVCHRLAPAAPFPPNIRRFGAINNNIHFLLADSQQWLKNTFTCKDLLFSSSF